LDSKKQNFRSRSQNLDKKGKSEKLENNTERYSTDSYDHESSKKRNNFKRQLTNLSEARNLRHSKNSSRSPFGQNTLNTKSSEKTLENENSNFNIIRSQEIQSSNFNMFKTNISNHIVSQERRESKDSVITKLMKYPMTLRESPENTNKNKNFSENNIKSGKRSNKF